MHYQGQKFYQPLELIWYHVPMHLLPVLRQLYKFLLHREDLKRQAFEEQFSRQNQGVLQQQSLLPWQLLRLLLSLSQ